MSKYNISLIVFLLFIIPTIVIGSAGLITAFVVLFIAVLTYASFNIQSDFYITAVNRAVTDKKSIVLSFDDGPSRYTPAILDILKEFDCKAIFFCIGNKVKGNELILKRIVEEGHMIGNHTFFHSPWFDFYSSKKMEQEMQRTKEALFLATGVRTRLFRPPYGVTNPMLSKAVRKLGYSVIGWSKRSLDTVIRDNKKVLRRISDNLKSGDIVLLHDTMAHSPEVLRKFLVFLKGTEFKVESLDKMIDMECFEMPISTSISNKVSINNGIPDKFGDMLSGN